MKREMNKRMKMKMIHFNCRLCSPPTCWQPKHERVHLTNCKCNNLCRKCVRDYVSNAINNKQIIIKCPICCKENNNIHEDDIGMLDGHLLRQYQGLVNEHYTREKSVEHRANGNQMTDKLMKMDCPVDDCTYSDVAAKWDTYDKSYFKCPLCKVGAFCKECGLSERHHKGLASCKLARDRCTNKWRYMECPNCYEWIENHSGMY